MDTSNVHGVLHYNGAPSAEPTTSTLPILGTKLEEYLLRPLENPGAPGGSSPATRRIDLEFGQNSGAPVEVRTFCSSQ